MPTLGKAAVDKPGKPGSKPKPASSSAADPRFARLAYDPTFAPSRKAAKARKVKVDARFQAVFDEGFAGPAPSKVDRYGRKLTSKTKASAVAMERYYEPEDPEARHAYLSRMARGEVELSSSSSSEDEFDAAEDQLPKSKVDQVLEAELGEPSGRRLAILNCDWDRLRAVDILALLRSFLPAGSTGTVLNVSIYPSEFGLERLKAEEVDGPQIPSAAKMIVPVRDEEPEDDESQDEDEDDLEGNPQSNEIEGEGFNPELLRAYEKDRLLYYFAVATCDSVATASALYDEVDGVEFGHSGNTLDVRFIPDAFVIPTLLKEIAASIPDNYTPLDFVTNALQSSKVELTWDEPEFDRRKLEAWDKDRFKKKGGAIKTQQLEMFLGSEDEDGGEDEEEARKRVERYRALLDRPLGSSSAKNGDGNGAVSSREAAASREEVKDDDDEEEEEEANEPEDDNEEDEEFSEDGGADNDATEEDTKGRGKASAARSGRADVLGKDGDAQAKGKHTKKKKKKRRIETTEGDIDVADARFADLYTNPSFSLDRTDPRFKANKVTARIEAERRARGGQGGEVSAAKKRR